MNGATAPAGRIVWREVDGILLLDKPLGLSSNQALQRVRRLYRAQKAGHTGSLDPLASGMLPVCFGQATKLCAYLLDSDKVYRARLKLGERTRSGDAESEVVERGVVPDFDAAALELACASLRGPIMQVPPMHSALKVGGQRLYALARRGVELDREPRPIEIFELSAVRSTEAGEPGGSLDFRVHCSKGTYVRALGEDLAARLCTVGHLSRLHRDWVAPFRGATIVSLDTLEAHAGDCAALDQLLLPLDAALPDWPAVNLTAEQALEVRFGRSIDSGLAPIGCERRVRLTEQGRLLALGAIAAGSSGIAPFRLFAPGAGTR